MLLGNYNHIVYKKATSYYSIPFIHKFITY